MTALGTPWVLTWKMVEGVKTAKARLVTKGYQGYQDIFKSSPLRLYAVGGCGASTLRMRSSKQMDLDVMCLSNPRLNAFWGIPVTFGN